MRQLVIIVTCDDHVTDTQDVAAAVSQQLAPALVEVRDSSPLAGQPTTAQASTFVPPEEP